MNAKHSFLIPLLAGLFASLFAASSYAGSATLGWTPPTQNTDGSALTNLASYKIYCATSNAGVPTTTPITVPAPASTYTVQALPVGTVYCAMSAVNSNGTESALTGTVSKVIPDLVPKPPSSLAITTVTATTVYKISQSVDGLAMVAVGTAPAGITCDGSVSVNGLYRVNRDAVKYPTGVIKPLTVWASCS